MGHYRRRVRDELTDLVFDALRAVRDDDSPAAIRAKMEREALRERMREERRRERAARGRLQLIGTGAGLLAGGLAVAPLGPIAAVGLGLMIGAIVFYLLKALAEQRPLDSSAARLPSLPKEVLPPEVDQAGLPKSRRELVQTVLDEAAGELTKLARAGNEIAPHSPETAATIARLVASGERLSDAVADEPNRFERAQRVFTYYLPRSVFVAQSFPRPNDPDFAKRSAESRHVLTRMEMLFEKATLEISNVDAAEMNLELRLINQALDEDLAVKVPRSTGEQT